MIIKVYENGISVVMRTFKSYFKKPIIEIIILFFQKAVL
jgi:hypothetical protein